MAIGLLPIARPLNAIAVMADGQRVTAPAGISRRLTGGVDRVRATEVQVALRPGVDPPAPLQRRHGVGREARLELQHLAVPVHSRRLDGFAANISVAASALPNLVALLLLSGVFIKLMKDYLSGDNCYATELIDKNRQYIRIAET